MPKDHEIVNTLEDSEARYIKSSELYDFVNDESSYTGWRNINYSLIRIFIVCLPAVYGGRPLVACWSFKSARSVVKNMKMAEERLSFEEYQKNYGMPPGLKPLIVVTTIGSLSTIPEREEDIWEMET